MPAFSFDFDKKNDVQAETDVTTRRTANGSTRQKVRPPEGKRPLIHDIRKKSH